MSSKKSQGVLTTAYDAQVGRRIRDARASLGLSQDALAKKLELPDQKTVSRLEQGRMRLSVRVAARALAQLGLSPDWLLFGEGPMMREDLRDARSALAESSAAYGTHERDRAIVALLRSALSLLERRVEEKTTNESAKP